MHQAWVGEKARERLARLWKSPHVKHGPGPLASEYLLCLYRGNPSRPVPPVPKGGRETACHRSGKEDEQAWPMGGFLLPEPRGDSGEAPAGLGDREEGRGS